MSNLRQAAQQALEALEEINKLSIGENAIFLPAQIDTAMDALRATLAEPEQEPVGTARELFTNTTLERLDIRPSTKVYLDAPPQRKPLSDEELEVLWDDATDRMEHFCSQYWDFARAIEAAHGIKGEA